MPKPLSRKRAAEAEEYDSDGGFVEDAPKSKKSRSNTLNGKTPAGSGQQTDGEGNVYWEISRARRVTVSDFKGKAMVSIREYYEKDGEMLPGKKGISLPLDQYSAFIEALPDIESFLKARGLTIARPKYDDADADHDKGEDEDAGEEQEEGAGGHGPASEEPKGKLDRFKMRANHEATSDEDQA